MFGYPGFKRFMEKSVITRTSSEGGQDHLDAPAVTVCLHPYENGDAFVTGGDLNRGFIDDLCGNPKTAVDVENCIEKRSYNLSQMINMTTTSFNGQTLNTNNWKSYGAHIMYGECFTIGQNLTLGKRFQKTDAFILFNSSLRFSIYIHDQKYFLISGNPYSIPQISKALMLAKDMRTFVDYQYIFVTKHKKINRKDAPCNDVEDYSFTKCIRTYVAKKTGCRTKWDEEHHDSIRKCVEVNKTIAYLQMYADFYSYDLDDVTKATGCQKPCSYIEYKSVGNEAECPVVN